MKKAKEKKLILDVCCGGRTFWWNKSHPRAIFIDKYPRPRGSCATRPNWNCSPDEIMDFVDLKFPDKTFKMVVFDPPHLSSLGEKSYMRIKYGHLKKGWQDEIRKGFDECWRVLDDYGTLVFKWNEHEVKISQVLKLFSQTPLFGHPTGKVGKTMWMCFLKIPSSKSIK